MKKQCLDILSEFDINPTSKIDFDVNGELHSLSLEYIIDSYSKASEESQLVFVTALKKSTKIKDMGVKIFFEGMGQLLLMTHLSQKFKTV